MSSDVDICNLALARLGDEANIVSISPPDQSAQAGYCARFYPMSLSAVLDEHNWGFNSKLVVLALTTNPSSLWDYCYEVPSDMISVIALYDTTAVGDVNYGGFPSNATTSSIYGDGSKASYLNRLATHGNQQDYSVESDTDGNIVLYANQQNAMLKYAAYTTNTAVFPPSFIDALAWKLASNLAGIMIKGDIGVSASMKCMQAYAMALRAAKDSDSQNRKVFPIPAPAGIAARA